ncbi:MAG TPA: hypothetical protein VNA28_16230 [Solirubrobacteraceae bacterium]|nr:hypothetical protein [Solirubrobacteraceae bacterium]
MTSSETTSAPLTPGDVLDLGDLTQPNRDVLRVCEIAGLDTLLSFEAEEAINRNV